MQFNSFEFLIFFPVVLAIYFVIPKKVREPWLLVTSYYFYMSWNAKYVFLIGASTLATYISGVLFSKTDATAEGVKTKKRLILALCIAFNLSLLFLFKYGNFAIDSVNTLLRSVRMTPVQRRFDFLLPVGISFYTFQALGYMIDVYRGDIPAERNLIRYALFVSFFPQLVAGPIERSGNLLSQMRNIENIRLWNARRVASGAILMVWGFFLKMVISDRAAILVNTVFDNYRMYGSTELITAIVIFSLQIYCDFYGYSVIATGAAKIMGFELMENFNTPFFANSIRDLWSRWHISLSTWFRDYLYIPLGGSRKGIVRQNINLLAVFLVSGLWHGANWSFVIWGGLHGVYQVFGNMTRPLRNALYQKLSFKTDCFSWRLWQRFVTYGLFVFSLIFFRSDSVTDALRYIKRIVVKPTPWLLFDGGLYTLGLERAEMHILVVSIAILFFVSCIRYTRGQTIDVFLMEQNMLFEWAVIIGLVLMIFVYGQYGPAFDAQQFIYFQF